MRRPLTLEAMASQSLPDRLRMVRNQIVMDKDDPTLTWSGSQGWRSMPVWKQVAELPGDPEVRFLCQRCEKPITTVRPQENRVRRDKFPGARVRLGPVNPEHVGSRWVEEPAMFGGQRVKLYCRAFQCPGRHRPPVVAEPLLSTLFLWGASGDGSVVVPSSTH